MHIHNPRESLIAFRVKLPSGGEYRVEIGAGETIGVSHAIRSGLEANQYYQFLVHSGDLVENYVE